MLIPICAGRVLNLCVWMSATIYKAYTIQQTPACPASMDLIIAMDASGSIGDDNFELCKDFVNDIVNSADIEGGNVRIGIMTYSSTVQIILHLNNGKTKEKLKEEIKRIHYTEGGTYIGKAIDYVRYMFNKNFGDRPDVKNVAFVITDGESSDDTATAANAAHAEGITIYAFGIGEGASRKNLRDMASAPVKEHVYTVNSFSAMDGLGDDLFSTMCSGITPQTTTSKETTTRAVTTTTPYTISTLTTANKETTKSVETKKWTTDENTSTESVTVQKTITMANTPEAISYDRTSTELITTQIITGVVSRVRKCMCPCDMVGDERYVNLTASQMTFNINALRLQLLRSKNSLSSWRRRLTSADDDRYSARLLGVSLSTVFLCISLVFTFLLDFDRYLRWFEKKFRKDQVDDKS